MTIKKVNAKSDKRAVARSVSKPPAARQPGPDPHKAKDNLHLDSKRGRGKNTTQGRPPRRSQSR